VFVRVLNMILILIVARFLGPSQQGTFSFLIMLAALIVNVSILGFDTAAIYFVCNKSVPERSIRSQSLPWIMSVSTLIIIALAALKYYERIPVLQPYGIGLLLIAALLVMIDAPGNLFRGLLMARERFEFFNRLDVFQSVIQIVFVSVSIAVWPNPVAALLAFTIAKAMTVVILERGTQANLGGSAHYRTRELFDYARFPWITNILSLLNVRIDTLLVAWFIGQGTSAEDLGLYTICALLINGLKEIQNSIQRVYFPKVCAADSEAAIHLAARVYRLSFPLYTVISIVVILLSWPGLLLFGQEYQAAWLTLSILIVGVMMVRANSGALSIFFSAQGRPAISMWLNATGVLSNLLLNLLLIPSYGIVGAAVATSLSALLVKVEYILAFQHFTKCSYRKDLLLRSSDIVDLRLMLNSLWRESKGKLFS
jgi:O-antigen/teichoic acid export membrane protein